MTNQAIEVPVTDEQLQQFIEVDERISFRHVRAVNSNGLLPNGGACLAYRVIKNHTISPETGVCIELNWAKCHSDDVYVKAKARMIASGRLDKNSMNRPNVILEIPANFKRPDINLAINSYFSTVAEDIRTGSFELTKTEIALGAEHIEIEKLIDRYYNNFPRGKFENNERYRQYLSEAYQAPF